VDLAGWELGLATIVCNMRTTFPFLELRPGWHPCPVDEGYERYVDGNGWTSQTRALPGHEDVLKAERVRVAIGWYDDPGDPSRLRYYDGLAWTNRVMPKPGTVAPWARRRNDQLVRLHHVQVVDVPA
jgi:hypothetical protein